MPTSVNLESEEIIISQVNHTTEETFLNDLEVLILTLKNAKVDDSRIIKAVLKLIHERNRHLNVNTLPF